MRLERLARRQHGQRGVADEVVREPPTRRARRTWNEVDQTCCRRPLQRLDDLGVIAADHRCQLARPALHAEDRGEGDDVSMLRRQHVERVLDRVLDDSSIIGRHGTGHGARQQQRTASGQPGQRRHPLVLLDLEPVSSEEGCRVLFVERAQRDDQRVPFQLVQPTPRLIREIRVVVSPRQHDHAPVDRAHQEADEQERRGVGQMSVVEHDRQRSAAVRLPSRLATAEKRLKRSASMAGRCWSSLSIPAASRPPSSVSTAVHGHSGGAPPSGQLRPHATVNPSAAARSTACRHSVVFPIPAGPLTMSSWLRPSRAAVQASAINASSRARPMNWRSHRAECASINGQYAASPRTGRAFRVAQRIEQNKSSAQE